jgi:hypothetical protein
MGLHNVEVDARRRDPEQLSPAFDVVTGRAFAHPAIFHRAAGAALQSDGLAILYATPEQELESRAAAESGLVETGPIAYAIPRAKRKIARLLSVWRKRDD